jgi:integrase
VIYFGKPKKSSWRDDESVLRRNLIPEFGTRLAPNLTTADMTAVHVRIGTQYPYATNDLLDIVRKMYNWAKSPAKLITKDVENPAVGIQRFPERKRRRFLTTVEMPQFIAALEAEDSEYARHAFGYFFLRASACESCLGRSGNTSIGTWVRSLLG